MKILHLLGWYFPDSVGGTEIYVAELCRRLRRAGHQPVVAAPTIDANAPTSYCHDGTQVFRYGIPRGATRDEACNRVAVRGAEVFNRWLEEQQPDVLHVHSFTTGVGIHEIRQARRLGVRVIATCHLPGFGYMCRAGELMRWGTEPCDGIVIVSKCAACNLSRVGVPRAIGRVVGSIPSSISAQLGRVPGPAGTALGMAGSVGQYQTLQRELFDLVDSFVVLNETARRMLLANGSDSSKIAVNRLGVACEMVRPKPTPGVRPTGSPVRFGFIGRLHPTKGLVPLLQAVRSLPSSVPFVVDIRGPVLDAATRDFVDHLRSIAAGDRRVVFNAAVSRADLPRVLADLDVLLCPSTWYENGPTIALEAQAVGTPVIGSAAGNLAEIIADRVNGRLVPPHDVSAWAQTLEETARDPEAIDRWRDRLPPVRTMDDVFADYLSAYGAS